LKQDRRLIKSIQNEVQKREKQKDKKRKKRFQQIKQNAQKTKKRRVRSFQKLKQEQELKDQQSPIQTGLINFKKIGICILLGIIIGQRLS